MFWGPVSCLSFPACIFIPKQLLFWLCEGRYPPMEYMGVSLGTPAFWQRTGWAEEKKWDLGTVPTGKMPNWHRNSPNLSLHHLPLRSSFMTVTLRHLADIAACHRIVTSSLHGMIAATTLEFPVGSKFAARWKRMEGTSNFAIIAHQLRLRLRQARWWKHQDFTWKMFNLRSGMPIRLWGRC